MKIYMHFLLMIASSLLVSTELIAQHEQKHENAKHKTEGIIEIITSGVVSYSPKIAHTLYGTEIHFTYWFNHTWGGGFSYSGKILSGDVLSDVALLASYNPTKWLTINTGPNIAFADGHLRHKHQLGYYAETEFNYRVSKWFHFGLLAGTVLSKNTELTTGIQLGFEF